MPAQYHRVDLRMPPEWFKRLELLKKEVYVRSGKYVSYGDLIREMMKPYMEDEDKESCFSSKK